MSADYHTPGLGDFMFTSAFTRYFTFENHRQFIAICKILFLAAAVMICGNLDAAGQSAAGRPVKVRKTPVLKRIQPNETNGSNTAPAQAENKAEVPVKIVNASAPVTTSPPSDSSYLTGDASVIINPKQPTVIRLGLAQNAVSIIEFPASDGVYYIHEGNPKLVSVFQSPTRETDRSITVYPGEGFVTTRALGSAGGPEPTATITLQMRSGLILILEFAPVADIRRNAHRCVINYNRDDVINARRTSGLAYNLGEDPVPATGNNSRAASKLISAPNSVGAAATENNEPGDARKIDTIRYGSAEIPERAGESRNSRAPDRPRADHTMPDFSLLVNRKLAEILKNPKKTLGEFAKSENGLAVATSRVTELDSTARLIIVAVRNDSLGNLRLVEGTPELCISTFNNEGNALQTERLERKFVETTSPDGLILPGSTTYYAIIYSAPVLGASQRISVLVSHREAADLPTVVEIPGIQNAKGATKK